MKICCSIGWFFSIKDSGLVLNTQPVHVGEISVTSKEAFRSLYSTTVIGAIGKIDISTEFFLIMLKDDGKFHKSVLIFYSTLIGTFMRSRTKYKLDVPEYTIVWEY